MTDQNHEDPHATGAVPTLEDIVRQLPDIVYRLDHRGDIIFINDAIRRYGYAPEELLGTPMTDIIHEEDRALAADRVVERRSHRRDHVPCEIRLNRGLDVPLPGTPGTGATALLSFEARGLYSEFPPSAESFIGTQGVARDVTEERSLQFARRRSMLRARETEKQLALGQLASSVASEIGEQLVEIKQQTADLGERLAGDEPLAALERIENAADDVDALLTRLRSFGACGLLTVARVDPAELMADLARELDEISADTLDFLQEMNLDDELLIGDPGRLQEMMREVGRNALDAMPDGGRIVLTARPLELSPEAHHGYPDEIPDGCYIELGCQDSGIGMDGETVGHIFEPFYTGRDGALGLGMAVVLGGVRDHLGAIRVQTEPGGGTHVRLLLPQAGSSTAAEITRHHQGTTGGQERIMLLEEDAVVRNLAARTLRSLGYHVALGQPSPDTPDQIRNAAQPFDLVILDGESAETGWRDMLTRIQEIRPETRVAVSARRLPRKVMDDIIEAGGCGVLSKPFHLGELAHELRGFLD